MQVFDAVCSDGLKANTMIDMGPRAKLRKDILARHMCGSWPDVSPVSGLLAPDLVCHPPEQAVPCQSKAAHATQPDAA